MKINGYFINLDSSNDRRKNFENQLNDLSLDWTVLRFSALCENVEGSIIKGGELGCFLSHEYIINNHNDDSTLLIFEDDAVILPEINDVLPRIMQSISKDVDIVFLGSGIDYANVIKIKDLIELKRRHLDNEHGVVNLSLQDAKEIYNHGTHAYLVTNKGISKLRSILTDQKNKNYPVAIDNLYRNNIQNGKLTAAVTFPFLVEINMTYKPTITNRVGVINAGQGDEILYSAASNIFSIRKDKSELLSWANKNLDATSFDKDAFIASQIIYKKLKLESAEL